MLYDYNRWCNARILDAAAGLTADQFLGPGRFPHGGVRGTLVHTLFAEWAWRMRWQGTPPRDPTPLRPDEFPTLAALHARWKAEDALLKDFVDGLTDQRLTSMLEYSSTEGGRHTRVLWETMVHLVNHGTQHRAEAAAMLTDLGHSPGDIDLIVYLNENRG
ncbi:MAG: DinB family protein [Candidatus Rokuibacteriota bacterium]